MGKRTGRPRGRPSLGAEAMSEQIVLRLSPTLLERIDAWAEEVHPELPRSVAVRGLVIDGLELHERRAGRLPKK